MKRFILALSLFCLAFAPVTITGPQPFVSVLCKFADVPTEQRGLPYFKAMYSAVYPGLDDYWREASYTKINLSGSTAHGWYTLPQTRAYYMATSDHLYAVAKDCLAAADNDVDYNDFSGVNMFFNAEMDGNSYGGGLPIELDGTYKEWRVTWLPPLAFGDIAVVAHEMGHAFGLPHSYGRGRTLYGNEWDVMSDVWTNCTDALHPRYGCLPQSMIAYDKYLLGWLGNRVYTAKTGAQTVTIGQLELPSRRGWLMAIVPIAGSTTHFYTVEVRTLAGYDVKLPYSAVIIYEVIENRLEPAALVKVLTDGTWSGKGVTIAIVSKTETSYTITIKK